MARPFLLIDVDGVLNPLAQAPGHVPAGYVPHDVDGLRVLLSTDHGIWLSDLASSYDLVWATSWEHDADRLIAEAVGLPRGLPVISFAAQDGWTNKLPDIIRYVGDRPLAWIDDQPGAEVRDWADARNAAGIPTLLVETDYRVGLTLFDVGRLREFALRLAGPISD
jgi:hypothetical protein